MTYTNNSEVYIVHDAIWKRLAWSRMAAASASAVLKN
jgi:hypothetical protein